MTILFVFPGCLAAEVLAVSDTKGVSTDLNLRPPREGLKERYRQDLLLSLLQGLGQTLCALLVGHGNLNRPLANRPVARTTVRNTSANSAEHVQDLLFNGACRRHDPCRMTSIDVVLEHTAKFEYASNNPSAIPGHRSPRAEAELRSTAARLQRRTPGNQDR